MTPPEDPRLLLAELESARLAMQARAKPRRRGTLLLILIIILAVGGATLWFLAIMAGSLTQEKPQKAALPAGNHEKLLCAERLSPLDSGFDLT